jgi:ABC-type dipeptide/oligopeptide/nickel transport system permease subunit
MPKQDFSFSNQTWQRLKKNRAALFGLLIIVIAIFISLSGYLVAPDASPNADLQTVEIQAKKPGYTQLFLKIPDKKNIPQGWFSKFTGGRTEDFRYLPISGYKVLGDAVAVNKYVDEDTSVVQTYSVNMLTGGKPENLLIKNIVTKKYYLGTDKFGRDILSRLIIGTKVSLRYSRLLPWMGR